MNKWYKEVEEWHLFSKIGRDINADEPLKDLPRNPIAFDSHHSGVTQFGWFNKTRKIPKKKK